MVDTELNFSILDEIPRVSYDIIWLDDKNEYALIYTDKLFKLVASHKLYKSECDDYYAQLDKFKTQIEEKGLNRTPLDLHVEEFLSTKLFVFTERTFENIANRDLLVSEYESQLVTMYNMLLSGEVITIQVGLMILLYGDNYLTGCFKPYLLWSDEITGTLVFIFHNWIPSVKFLESHMLDNVFRNSYKYISCESFIVTFNNRDLCEFEGYYNEFTDGVPYEVRNLFSNTKLRYDEFCILLSSDIVDEDRLMGFDYTEVVKRYESFVYNVNRICPNICEEILYHDDVFNAEYFKDCVFNIAAGDTYSISYDESSVIRLICNMRYKRRNSYLSNSKLYFDLHDLVIERIVLPNMFNLAVEDESQHIYRLDFAMNKLHSDYVYKHFEACNIKSVIPIKFINEFLDKVGVLTESVINNDFITVKLGNLLKGDFDYDILTNYLFNTLFIQKSSLNNKYSVKVPVVTDSIADIKEIYTHSDFARDCIFSLHRVETFYNYIRNINGLISFKVASYDFNVTKFHAIENKDSLFLDLLYSIVVNLNLALDSMSDYHGKYTAINLTCLINYFDFDEYMLKEYERHIKTAIAIVYLLHRHDYQCAVFGVSCLDYDKIKLELEESGDFKSLVVSYEG